MTITLYDANGNQVGDSFVTGGDGTFHFDNLLPGTYTIKETPSFPIAGVNGHMGSLGGLYSTIDHAFTVSLQAGDSGFDYGFGEVPLGGG